MTLQNSRWTWSAMDADGDGKISEREWMIRPGPYDGIKQLLLSNLVGDRLHAIEKVVLRDLPFAVHVHSAPLPPRLRQRHAVDVLHGLLLLGFVNESILVLVQHREPERNSLRPMTYDREVGQI